MKRLLLLLCLSAAVRPTAAQTAVSGFVRSLPERLARPLDDTLVVLRDLDFDRTLYRRMHRYLKREDPNMVMIYGANDPWTASGAAWAVTPRKRNMKLFVQPGGSHRTRIATLPESMREEAIAAIRGWLE